MGTNPLFIDSLVQDFISVSQFDILGKSVKQDLSTVFAPIRAAKPDIVEGLLEGEVPIVAK
jgi:hypothetical protein